MEYQHQGTGWLECIEHAKTANTWSSALPKTQKLVCDFEDEIKSVHDPKKRANIVTPFTNAVRKLLLASGLPLDKSAKSIVSEDGYKKQCDISFVCEQTLWIVEVKTNLDFNSLGAAVLEAMLFKHKMPDCKTMLISLYEKNINGDLVKCLSSLFGKPVFDSIHLLSSNRLDDKVDLWHEHWIMNINSMVRMLETISQKTND